MSPDLLVTGQRGQIMDLMVLMDLIFMVLAGTY